MHKNTSKAFDPTNDKSNPDNHGWRNSEFERGMDNDTKEMLWRVMDENSQLKQENMM